METFSKKFNDKQIELLEKRGFKSVGDDNNFFIENPKFDKVVDCISVSHGFENKITFSFSIRTTLDRDISQTIAESQQAIARAYEICEQLEALEDNSNENN